MNPSLISLKERRLDSKRFNKLTHRMNRWLLKSLLWFNSRLRFHQELSRNKKKKKPCYLGNQVNNQLRKMKVFYLDKTIGKKANKKRFNL